MTSENRVSRTINLCAFLKPYLTLDGLRFKVLLRLDFDSLPKFGQYCSKLPTDMTGSVCVLLCGCGSIT